LNYSLLMKTAASVLLIGTLAACGGGGSIANAPVTAPTTFTVSGTAATGVAFDGATITIIGSDGATYGGTTSDVTGADGTYTITLPLTAKSPFVVKAARDDQTLVSVVAETKDTTTNITPVTNLIASRLSTSGDPAKLADELQANPALFDATTLQTKVAEIVALIQPLMDAVGDNTDPLNGTIVADGTGADKVLDSLSISITPSSATTVNIEVSVKQKLPEGDNPAVIAFTNTTPPPAPLPTVAATDLVPDGTATLIADLLQRMTACAALPQADRVGSGGTTAADIIAPACKDVFVGNDPASYLSNGKVVSSTGAFSDIFSSGSGASFDRGSYEFTRGGTGATNGDLVIAYRKTSPTGDSINNTLATRIDTDGKLRAIGNQYQYDGGVNAYQQLRTFVNTTGADYYSTGYNLSVNNTTSGGSSIFAKVVVTTPKGNVLTLKPSVGSSYLPLVKNGAVTGTNFLRIRSVYTDPANSAKDPSTAEANLFFAATPASDEEIASFPAQSTWKFEYYLAGNATTTPDATQYYKTRARAMTIAELQAQPLAAITAAQIAAIKAETVTGGGGGKYVPTPTSGPVTLEWEVPEGALAPTSIQVYGNAGSFNDKAKVGSTARSGDISCSPASLSDTHCDGSGNFAAGGKLSGLHLWVQDQFGRDFASFYAAYVITP